MLAEGAGRDSNLLHPFQGVRPSEGRGPVADHDAGTLPPPPGLRGRTTVVSRNATSGPVPLRRDWGASGWTGSPQRAKKWSRLRGRIAIAATKGVNRSGLRDRPTIDGEPEVVRDGGPSPGDHGRAADGLGHHRHDAGAGRGWTAARSWLRAGPAFAWTGSGATCLMVRSVDTSRT